MLKINNNKNQIIIKKMKIMKMKTRNKKKAKKKAIIKRRNKLSLNSILMYHKIRLHVLNAKRTFQ